MCKDQYMNSHHHHISAPQTSVMEALELSRNLRLAEVERLVGLGRSSIYSKMAQGKFPKGKALSLRCRRWPVKEIKEWLEGQP